MKNIIINEAYEVERIFKNGFTRKRINIYELGLLAKHYHAKGLKPSKIKAALVNFCTEQDPNFNVIVYAAMLRRAITSTKSYGLRDKVMNVAVTRAELNAIRFLPHKYYRLLFLMLVLSKIEKFNKARLVPRPEMLGYYVNQNFYVLLKMSGMRVTRAEADKIKYMLDGQMHFISATLINENKWKILFADENSPAVLIVEDMEHILDYIPYFCVKCGSGIGKKSKQHDMCPDCYKEYRKEKVRENVRRHRLNA